ncbi:hypothetical protein OUZ56_031870 [Daphnia magna]|uniref:Uncharacterized protein n=1 Tax=Daphnia magna TaxID=35525 RepID=A0ABQ9ZVG2_9CRUS|nr:hypothetical protein OUZ56_031870 [Daphnia magna]
MWLKSRENAAVILPTKSWMEKAWEDVGSRWDAEDLASPEKRADHSDVNCLLEFISVGERIFYGAKSVRAGSATPLQLSTLRLREPVL